MTAVTQILDAITRGDPKAASQLLPLVYDELRRLAALKLALEKPGHSLQPTALVHEAYLRLVGTKEERRLFKDRGHFFAAAAAAMRRILIDNARRKKSDKRGGQMQRAAWNDNMEVPANPLEDVLAIDDALMQLAGQDAQAAGEVGHPFETLANSIVAETPSGCRTDVSWHSHASLASFVRNHALA